MKKSGLFNTTLQNKTAESNKIRRKDPVVLTLQKPTPFFLLSSFCNCLDHKPKKPFVRIKNPKKVYNLLN